MSARARRSFLPAARSSSTTAPPTATSSTLFSDLGVTVYPYVPDFLTLSDYTVFVLVHKLLGPFFLNLRAPLLALFLNYLVLPFALVFELIFNFSPPALRGPTGLE